MNKDEGLKQIGEAFKNSVIVLEETLVILENQPKRDLDELIHQVGAYLCHGSPCSYHKGEAQNLINMMKKHYNIQ